MKHPDFKQFARVPVVFPKKPSIWGMLDPPIKFEIPNPNIEQTTEKFLNRLEQAQRMISNADMDIRGYKCDMDSMNDEMALLEDFEVKVIGYIIHQQTK
jgi:hypothetical protein